MQSAGTRREIDGKEFRNQMCACVAQEKRGDDRQQRKRRKCHVFECEDKMKTEARDQDCIEQRQPGNRQPLGPKTVRAMIVVSCVLIEAEFNMRQVPDSRHTLNDLR